MTAESLDDLVAHTRNAVVALRDERDALQAEVVALREDAERYRFLRDHRTFHHGVSILIAADPGAPSGDVTDNAEFVDAAIDSARLAEKDKV